MTAARHIGLSLAVATLGLAAVPAQAERLIASVSNHRVTITPNYVGEQLVLFGSIERDARTPASRTAYDLVVTVTGPRVTMVTRRKERTLGVWVNSDSHIFENVPSYLAVFANRPIDTIVNADTARKQQVGIDFAFAPPGRKEGDDAGPFRDAFFRLKGAHGLYRESTNAVTFLAPTLFRTTIPLPAEVPTGTYTIEIKAFADGNLITRTDTAFEIVKIGFEHFVADSAENHGLVYGVIAALLALLTGWLASIIFRKD